MALRARLSAPAAPPPQTWPWHKLDARSLPVSLMLGAGRRMEAESFLSPGFGIRMSIEQQPSGWRALRDIARVWMPGRLKGIQVDSDFGTPFLGATQVFDLRPIPRKWLALAKTYDSINRFVKTGQMLVTCSGSVGRTTIACSVHEEKLISHDLLRVDSVEESHRGWLYAYLCSPHFRAMATSAHYGHIIKHLERSHLESLPMPEVDDDTASRFNGGVQRIIALRNQAYRLTLEAEHTFEQALGPIKIGDWGENGFSTKASQSILSGRRRMEGLAHNPGAIAIRHHLAKNGQGFTSLCDAGYQVWLPTRFKRIAAANGRFLLSSSDLTSVNPDLTKRIADRGIGDPYKGRVRGNWILMARSGQNYGIIGTAVLATPDLFEHIISDHVMRLRPSRDSSIPPGYLVTALTHPALGRPLVKSLAYGSSIPEIEVADMAAFEVVRLSHALEDEIADLAEAAAKARSEADLIEQQIGVEAGEIIEQFIGS